MSSSSSPSRPKLVLVTGANGYIASMLIKTLLEQGYKVRGTVRDPSNETKTAGLRELPGARENLELVPLELTDSNPETFENAVKDVEWVMHAASPVSFNKPEAEIVGPAVQGTNSMLNAAYKQESVTKFIFLSSVAAIMGGNQIAPDEAYTEETWTNLDGPRKVSPYTKSKTLAEKAAWDFMKEHPDAKFTLSSINPSFVLGPVATSTATSSTEIISRIFQASDPGSISFYMPIVDVREVVQALIQAAILPEAAGKRFIVSQSDGGELFMSDFNKILAKKFDPPYKIKTWVLPKWLVWFISWMDSDVAVLYSTINNRQHIDNTRSREILKIEYTPAEETIIDGALSMIEHGIIQTPPEEQE